jgi:hypothetical protein
MTRLVQVASLACILLTACDPENRCGIYTYDPVRHACACPAGSMWTEDLSECVPIDAGPGDASRDLDARVEHDAAMIDAQADAEDAPVCEGGLMLCGGVCVEWRNLTEENCGGCNRPCFGPANHCINAECRPDPSFDAGSMADAGNDASADGGDCSAPRMLCEGECVEVRNSGLHCGGCNRPCTNPGVFCDFGECVAIPDAG